MGLPIVRNTLQSTILSATSNILAQLIKAYRAGTPLTINPSTLLTFTLFTALNTPPNVLWQDFLESTFPAQTLQPVTQHISQTPKADSLSSRELDKRETEWVEEVRMEKKMNWRNTGIKFGLDQTLGALVNTVVFLAVMAAAEGKGWSGVVGRVGERTWPLMSAGYKLWPFVSICLFTIVPPELRMLVGSLVGVGWGVFLSLFASR